jgi:enoyl-CoA hydratase
MSYETILVERQDAVTLFRINRPEALNALNSSVLAELVDAFERFDSDPNQRCAVVTGSEKAFAAGADIKEVVTKSFTDLYLEDFFSQWNSDVRGTRKPWIAAVAGFALGGGCELAMLADFIIAADNAMFGQPEIKLGVAPGMGGSQRLARAVGKAKTMDMCLTGRMMDANEAERSGLVSRVVPLENLLDHALEAARTIAAAPTMSAMINKEMVDLAFESTLTQGLAGERRLFHLLTATADRVEGMSAFIEKRAPNWTGR